MADSNTQLQWTDEQWNKVRQVVYEEARKARVAGSFLPLYGPLEPNIDFVPQQTLDPVAAQLGVLPAAQADVLTVEDNETILRLSTLQVEVFLRGAQVADPELASALIAFRRAANILARLEDAIIFRGQPAADQGPPLDIVAGPWQVRGGDQMPGLLNVPDRLQVVVRGPNPAGDAVVARVSDAIGRLEATAHLGPFACVLGHQYFTAVQTPRNGVLPQDQILPFLGGGPLLRSSVVPQDCGLVIALAGAPIDLVVATDISVSFLQVTTDPYFVFRVYEKMVLRINQPDAIAVLGEEEPREQQQQNRRPRRARRAS